MASRYRIPKLHLILIIVCVFALCTLFVFNGELQEMYSFSENLPPTLDSSAISIQGKEHQLNLDSNTGSMQGNENHSNKGEDALSTQGNENHSNEGKDALSTQGNENHSNEGEDVLSSQGNENHSNEGKDALSTQSNRDNWDGEILLSSNPTTKEIVFTEEYQKRMSSKGIHPLSLKHKHYYERVQIVEKFCNKSSSKSQGSYMFAEGLRSVLFNDEAKLLLCTVPKIGSTTWSYVFMKMLDHTYDMSIISKQYPIFEGISLRFSGTDVKLMAKRYQTYLKCLVTRNPFERVLSAYVDKFTKANEFYEPQLAPTIIRANYLSHLKQELIESAKNNLKSGNADLIVGLDQSTIHQIKRLDAGLGKYDITFREFIVYIIKAVARSGRNSLDYHWRPVASICNPCLVRYDFIAKFETLYEDSQAILEYAQANIEDKVQFPEMKPATTNDRCDKAFSNIPMDEREMLYQVYEEDFVLFNYTYTKGNTGSIC